MIDILFNFSIIKADNSVAELFKLIGSKFILLFLGFVNLPINFYDQATGGTVEISYKSAERMLPPKFEASHLPVA